jgi:hypothetical protein
MARLNLLKSSFSGKVGDTVGVAWKNKTVIKAKVEGKKKNSALQTANVRAFEALCRISAVIAKLSWHYLYLSDRKMLRHNAVAKWLKPLIRNHAFEPENIYVVIPRSGSLCLAGIVFFPANNQFSVRFYSPNNTIPPPGWQQVLLLFNQSGVVIGGVIRQASLGEWVVHAPRAPSDTIYALSYVVSPTYERYTLEQSSVWRGVGLQYSLTEQPTGDFWLDGQPIFQRTFSDRFSYTGGTTASIAIPFGYRVRRILHCEISIPSHSIFYAATPFAASASDTSTTLDRFAYVSHTEGVPIANLTFRSNANLSNSLYYITLRYIKL